MSRQHNKAWKHETSIANMFSKWSGLEFIRTPASGALRWNNKSWTYCDICPPEEMPVVIECKHWEKPSLEGLLTKDTYIFDWWRQALSGSKRASKNLNTNILTILVFKANHRPNMAMMQERDVRNLSSGKLRRYLCKNMGSDVSIFPLSSFFENVKPKDLTIYLSV